MDIEDFDYHLEPRLSVRRVPEARGGGRLMVVHRDGGAIEHRRIEELPDIVQGRTLYGNDTAVAKCRLEILLPPRGIKTEGVILERMSAARFRIFARIPKHYPVGSFLTLADGSPFIIRARDEGDHSKLVVDFIEPPDLERVGSFPLPPWVERPSEPYEWDLLEPVWAKKPGSQARATAGATIPTGVALDLDLRMLTLHIGLETYDTPGPAEFATRKTHRESYRIEDPPMGKVVAIGSTVARALEAFYLTGEAEGEADVFLAPGHTFGRVNGLLTNFHFPMESVLVLTCAFGGTDLVLRAYRKAVEMGYRIGDWGDSMLIL